MKIHIRIEGIEGHDRQELLEAIKKDSPELFAAGIYSLPDTNNIGGVLASWMGGITIPEALNFTLTVAASSVGSVALNVLSSWLYDKLKDRAEQVTINNKTVPVQIEAINDALNNLAEGESQPPRA